MFARLAQLGFLLAGVLNAALALGFAARMPWAVSLWPWPDTRLSLIFVGSVLGAFSAGSLLAWWTGRGEATGPSCAGILLICLTCGAWLGWLTLADPAAGYGPHAIVLLAAAAATLPFLVCAYRMEGERERARPLVRWSCAVFALALGGVGAALLVGVEPVLPWPLSPSTATLFGLIYLGLSAVYALTALAGGPVAGLIVLAGFLVYDIILLPPLLMHFANVAPERLPSLVVYCAVLVYSAVLAVAMLVSERRRLLVPAG